MKKKKKKKKKKKYIHKTKKVTLSCKFETGSRVDKSVKMVLSPY